MKKSDKEKIENLESEIEKLEKRIENLKDKVSITEYTITKKQGMAIREYIQTEVEKSFNKKFAKELMRKLIVDLAEEL